MIGWKEYRVKDIARQMGSGTTPSSKVERYYDSEDYHWINSGDFNDSDIYGGKQMISELAVIESSALRFYMPDTVLVAMYGASIGKVGMLKVKATVNQACCAIVPNTKIVLPYFLFYLFINSKDALISKSFGGTQPNVSQGLIANMIFRIPSLSAQQKIVDYLDEKTSAIDTQIDLLEKKKDAYTRLKKAVINRVVTRGLDEHVKLKDSGVEWIGMIPEHWEVKRGKDIGKITHGVSFTPDDLREENDGVLIMRASNIQNGQLSYYDNVYVSSELIPRSKLLKKNDIIICGTNGSLELVGKSTIIKDDINASYGSFMLRFQTSQNASFIHFQLSQLVEMYRGLFATTTINQLTISQFQSFLFSLPPLSEQQAIATYLDGKCAKIDAALANIDKQIDALKRLKRSLINEVITGQRTV
jgi:Restriction endonuclease S subunits